MGRPSDFTDETAAAICQRLSDGESLRQICKDDSMPCMTTVMKWAREKPEFAKQYAHAREALLEYWAEEITEIADDGSNDWTERETRSGRKVQALDDEHVRRSHLRIETRKWLLSKLAPKKYGDRIINQNQSLDKDGNPVDPPNFGLTFPKGGPGQPMSEHARTVESEAPSSEN